MKPVNRIWRTKPKKTLQDIGRTPWEPPEVIELKDEFNAIVEGGLIDTYYDFGICRMNLSVPANTLIAKFVRSGRDPDYYSLHSITPDFKEIRKRINLKELRHGVEILFPDISSRMDQTIIRTPRAFVMTDGRIYVQDEACETIDSSFGIDIYLKHLADSARTIFADKKWAEEFVVRVSDPLEGVRRINSFLEPVVPIREGRIYK